MESGDREGCGANCCCPLASRVPPRRLGQAGRAAGIHTVARETSCWQAAPLSKIKPRRANRRTLFSIRNAFHAQMRQVQSEIDTERMLAELAAGSHWPTSQKLSIDRHPTTYTSACPLPSPPASESANLDYALRLHRAHERRQRVHLLDLVLPEVSLRQRSKYYFHLPQVAVHRRRPSLPLILHQPRTPPPVRPSISTPAARPGPNPSRSRARCRRSTQRVSVRRGVFSGSQQ